MEGAVTVSGKGWWQFGPDDNPTKFQKPSFKKVAHAAMDWADNLNPNGILRAMTEEEVEAEIEKDGNEAA